MIRYLAAVAITAAAIWTWSLLAIAADADRRDAVQRITRGMGPIR